MKYNATRKLLNDRYNKIIVIGYCEAHYLLRGYNAVAYNSGVYGWNYDVYEIQRAFDTVAIITGYRPNGPAWAIHADYETLKKYEGMAKDIWNNYNMDYERQKMNVEQILQEFIKEVLQK